MLGSPVAGAFLALAFAAWTLDDVPDRLWRGFGLGVACFGPYLVLMRLFPSGGWFPYHAQSFLISVGISVLLLVFVPRQHRVLRIAAGLHIVGGRRGDGRADSDGREHQPADDVLRRSDPRRRHPGRPAQAAAAARRAAPVLAVEPVDRRRRRRADRPQPHGRVLRATRLRAGRRRRRARPGARRDRADAASLGGRRGGARDPDRPRLVAAARHGVQPAVLRRHARLRLVPRVAPPRGRVVSSRSPTASSTSPASARRR